MRAILIILMLLTLAPATAAQESIQLPGGEILYFGRDGRPVHAKRSPTVYFLDSVRVKFDPIDKSLLKPSEVSATRTITNRDSLLHLKLASFDTAVFIFTKAWEQRTPVQKSIPCTAQLYQVVNTFYYNNEPYSGKVIDYYIDGTIQHRGSMERGKRVGTHYHHREDGTIHRQVFEHKGSREKEIWFTPKDSMYQKILRRNDVVVLWERYYENGALQTRYTSVPGIKTVATSWFSNGKLRDSVALDYKGSRHRFRRSGKTAFIKGLIEIGDYNLALEQDSTYPDIFAARASAHADSLYFDAAISDLDHCIRLEPLDHTYFGQRAYTRIRKYAHTAGLPPFREEEILNFLATKPTLNIPEDELKKIRFDLYKGHVLPGLQDYGCYKAYQLLTGNTQ